MSYRVEIGGPEYAPWALIKVEGRAIFLVSPSSRPCPHVAEVFAYGIDPLPDRRLQLDPQGAVLAASDTWGWSLPVPTENFGWLLDLAMDAGLEFPALQGGNR